MKHTFIVVSPYDELYHHGIKGQKWGIRRFQNEDGSLTPEGVARYGVDVSGNMSKKGAANYYRDIYNDAKRAGYKGQAVHQYVKNHFDSEEQYLAYVKNYRDYKKAKAAKAAVAGIAGTAAATALVGTGAVLGARAIAKGNRKIVNNAMLNTSYGQQFKGMSADQLVELSKSKKHLGNNVKEDLKNLLDSKMAGRAAEEAMAKELRSSKKRYKYMNNEQAKNILGVNSDTEALRTILENKYNKINAMPSNTKLDRMNKQIKQKEAKAIEKELGKRMTKEYGINAKLAAFDQTRQNVGKDAVQNRMNAFSNSFLGTVTSNSGTLAGAMALNVGLETTRKTIEKFTDAATAARVTPKPFKETKDKSSALTQPVRMDKAWQKVKNDDNDDKDKDRDRDRDYDDDDYDDDDERRRKRD